MDSVVRRRCPQCSIDSPAGTGVCPKCGALSLRSAETGRFGVVVEAIPSLKLRREAAALCGQWLADIDVERLETRLAGERVLLVNDVTADTAEGLIAALRKLHVAARVVEGPQNPSPFRALAKPLPWLGLAAGVGADIVLAQVVGIPVTPWGYVGGAAAFVLLWLLGVKALGPEAPAGHATGDDHALPGWPEAAPAISELLRSAPDPVRADLSALLSAVAEIQADIAAGTLASYAAGGPGGALAQSVRTLLTQGLQLARTAVAGHAAAATGLAGLRKAAEGALERYRAIGLAAAAGPTSEAPDAADVQAVAARVDAALNDAAAAIDILRQ